jgi:Predicted membrane protein
VGFSTLLRLSESPAFFSIKIYLAAMLALTISLVWNLEYTFWPLMCVYIFAQPFSGGVRAKCLQAVLATLGGGIVGVLVAGLVHSLEFELVVLTLLMMVGLALACHQRHSYFYLYLLGGLTGLLVAMPGITTPDATFMRSVSRLQDVLVGAVALVLVDTLLFPRSVEGQVRQQADTWTAGLRELIVSTLRRQPAKTTRGGLIRQLVPASALVDGVAFEGAGLASRRSSRALAGLLTQGVMLLPLLSALVDLEKDSTADDGGVRGQLADWIEQGCPEAGATSVRRSLRQLHSSSVARSERRLLYLIYAACRRMARGGPFDQAHWPSSWPIPHSVAQVEWGAAVRGAMTVGLYMIFMGGIWSITGWSQTMGFGMLLGAIFCAVCGLVDSAMGPALLIKLAKISTVAMLLVAFYVAVVFPNISAYPVLMLTLFPPLYFFGLSILKAGGIVLVIIPMALLRIGVAPGSVGVVDVLNDTLTLLLGLGAAYIASLVTQQSWARVLANFRRRDRDELAALLRAPFRRRCPALGRSLDRYLLLQQRAVNPEGELLALQALRHYRLLELIRTLKRYERGRPERREALQPLWRMLRREACPPEGASAELRRLIQELPLRHPLGHSATQALVELDALLANPARPVSEEATT